MPASPSLPGGAALRAVAAFEALKGAAALAGVAGLLVLMHHDLHRLALELIGHVGHSPHAHWPDALLRAADRVSATPAGGLALLGVLYAAVRFVEAFGLWRGRAWGEGFGALSGAVYVPFEVRHLLHRPTWQSALVLAFNVAVVAFLARRLARRRVRVPAPPARTPAG